VTLASAASGPGAKLTGKGKLTAGLTEIYGGNGWEARATAPDIITIAHTGTSGESTISGTAGKGAVLAGDTNAIIRQKDGSGKLTLTDVTVDVSTEGSKIELVAAQANPGQLELANNGTGTVKTGITSGAAISGTNLTAIGGAAIAPVAISDLDVNCVTTLPSTYNLYELKTGSGGAKIIKADGSNTGDNIVFAKDVEVTN
jgi:hypothetical protein